VAVEARRIFVVSALPLLAVVVVVVASADRQRQALIRQRVFVVCDQPEISEQPVSPPS
jgi:hypothetical protein